MKIRIDSSWDWQFIALLPALNINLHCEQIEFEWLCFAVYIYWEKI